MIRRLRLLFGFLIGAMWMGEVLFGNLGDTALLGNVRTFHFHAYRAIGWSFVCGALAFTALGGFYSAYRTGDFLVALQVAIWSGLISGAITLTTLLAMTAFFLDALQRLESSLDRTWAGHYLRRNWRLNRKAILSKTAFRGCLKPLKRARTAVARAQFPGSGTY
ncbi:MAG TPA: hypothetical protein VGG97_14445 [Bryobacteraceae bacterium]|jgi:hypothetical protein